MPARTEVRPGEAVPFTVVNGGPAGISFGTDYSLQRCEQGWWVQCDGTWLFPAVLIRVRPRKRHKLAAEIPKDAPPGRYRVAKEILTIDGPVVLDFEINVLDGSENRAPGLPR
jgi:hypothetical protein